MTEHTCAVSGAHFTISANEAELRERLAPHLGGRRIPLPTPKLCPEERHRRRLGLRNERYLYRNTSAVSGAPLISSYSPDKKLSVVTRREWLELDNTELGMPFDFNRPVFDQLDELSRRTYKANVIADGEMLNSDYCHFCGWSKNCYLTFDSGKNEDCAYGVLFAYCRNCFDCFYSIQSELCFDCVRVQDCYELFHSQFCMNCSSSAFLTDCVGCKNCLCCVNLRNKEYYAFNQPVGKAEFERLRSEIFNGSFRKHASGLAQYEAFLRGAYRRPLRNISSVNVSGDLLTSCADVFDSYNCTSGRDFGHCHDCMELEHCLDISMFGEGLRHCYELSGCGGARGKTEVSNSLFSSYIFYGGHDILYSMSCHQNCTHLFACTDLSRKSHCILNKQYSPAEYEALLPRVIEHMEKTGEWGEFFPLSMSPYGYNESLAQEFLPLDREGAHAIGANWSDFAPPPPTVAQSLRAGELPDILSSNTPFALDTGIVCEATGKLFRVISQELEFALTYGLPLPRLHPEERQRLRSRRMNRRRLLTGRCSKSGVEVVTTYTPDKQAQIVSDAVYNDIVD